MKKVERQDIRQLKALAKKLAITSTVRKALISDTQKGIVLTGETRVYQSKLTPQSQLSLQFHAHSHIQKALDILEDRYRVVKPGLGKLILDGVPKDKKIAILKVVRILTGFGLKEAKALIENTPSYVLKNCAWEEIEDAAEQLKKVGATVIIK